MNLTMQLPWRNHNAFCQQGTSRTARTPILFGNVTCQNFQCCRRFLGKSLKVLAWPRGLRAIAEEGTFRKRLLVCRELMLPTKWTALSFSCGRILWDSCGLANYSETSRYPTPRKRFGHENRREEPTSSDLERGNDEVPCRFQNGREPQ